MRAVRCFVVWLAMLLVYASPGAFAGVSATKHNLSVSSEGTYKATSEQQICVFCHTPHNAKPAAPLWNHAESGATYTPYSSTTLAASPGQPTGTSKLCLSCHDGTVALGSVHNLPGGEGAGVVSGLDVALTGENALATDLGDDHPVSFAYDSVLLGQNSELQDPAALTGTVRLDDNAEVQCPTCHDPHTSENPKFLRMAHVGTDGYGSPLCRECHVKKYWSTVTNMTHRESTNTYTVTDPWHLPLTTVKENGCENCHKPHSGGGGGVLLKAGVGDATFNDDDSGVCLSCHNGNVAAGSKDINTALNKLYTHPVKEYTGRHKAKRVGPGTIREDAVDLANRHAECYDCHNPHAVSPGTSPNVGDPEDTNNLASNVLKGTWGVEPVWQGLWGDIMSYTEVDDVQYQYQLCLKCHSYYAFGLSPPAEPYGYDPVTLPTLTDQAKEFNPNNKSYHPVVTTGKNDFIAFDGVNYSGALINGMTPKSLMTCAECHSDSLAVDGLKGPHGSDVWPILWGPYDFTTGMTGTENHLCFKCHDTSVYGGGSYSPGSENQTGFSGRSQFERKNLHNKHIAVRNVPCLACHAAVPHGWKRRAFLVYGTGTPDEAPYNAHERFPINGSTYYGLNSGIDLDAIESGNWQKSDCHSASDAGTSGVTGVGSCS